MADRPLDGAETRGDRACRGALRGPPVPRAHLAGLNLVGLKRHGFDNDVCRQLQDILDALFAEPGTIEQRLEEIRRLNGFTSDGPAQNLITFLTQATQGRGFTGPLE